MNLKETLKQIEENNLVISRVIGEMGRTTLLELGCSYIPLAVEFRREI